MRYNYYKNLLNSIEYASAIASNGQRVLLVVDTDVGYEIAKLPVDIQKYIVTMSASPYMKSKHKVELVEKIDSLCSSVPFDAIVTNQNLPLMQALSEKLEMMTVQVSQGTRRPGREAIEVTDICNQKFKIFNDHIEEYLLNKANWVQKEVNGLAINNLMDAIHYACEPFKPPHTVSMYLHSCLIVNRLHIVYRELVERMFERSTLYKTFITSNVQTDHEFPLNGLDLASYFLELSSAPDRQSVRGLSQEESLIAMDLTKEIVQNELHNFEQLCPVSFSFWVSNFIEGFNYQEIKKDLVYEPNASEEYLKEEGYL